MTKEVALNRVKGYLTDIIPEEGYSAVEEIMTALEQESSEDTISRQQAIDKMQELEDKDIKAYGCEIPECFDGQMATEALMTLQPISQQSKKGRWILSGGYWRCFDCKEKALLKLDKTKGSCREYIPIKSNFCPSCGLKMEV